VYLTRGLAFWTPPLGILDKAPPPQFHPLENWPKPVVGFKRDLNIRRNNSGAARGTRRNNSGAARGMPQKALIHLQYLGSKTPLKIKLSSKLSRISAEKAR
jgi:hypothetical protein